MRIGAKSVGVGLVLLATAVGLQFLPHRREHKVEPIQPLAGYLPAERDGWRSEDTPLGDTEFTSGEVRRKLRFDDYVYRTYSRGGTQIGVFCAYWRPGAASINEVGVHNPDVCWGAAGWSTDRTDEVRRLPVGAQSTYSGQYRLFRHRDTRQWVVFWHLIGGRLSGDAMGLGWRRIPYVLQNWRASNFGVVENEQFFVRISSNVDLDGLRTDPVFVDIVRSVAQFGLVEMKSG